MRKLLAGALVGAVVLAIAAIAYATTTTTYHETFINKKGKLVKTKSTSVPSAKSVSNAAVPLKGAATSRFASSIAARTGT